jgi:YjbE family integral membrane protein
LDPAIFALLQVILIDIVLAGDNAIVIGMAAARLPVAQRHRVIFWGLAAAVILRILLAMVTATLLSIIGLMVAGGVLLLWVAWRLYRDLRHHDKAAHMADTATGGSHASDVVAQAADGDPRHMRQAIIQITLADLSMSLDNVLAVAGAAMHHLWVLAVGLLLSIALMGVAANMVAGMLNRYRWIGYAGLLIVVYVALSMIWDGSHQVIQAM